MQGRCKDSHFSLTSVKTETREKQVVELDLGLAGQKGCVQTRGLWRPHLELRAHVLLFVNLSRAPAEIHFKIPVSLHLLNWPNHIRNR